MSKLILLFVTFFILASAVVNFDEELVVQLAHPQDASKLDSYLKSLKFASKFQLVTYFDGEIKSATAHELARFFLIENELHDDQKENLRQQLAHLSFITASFIKPKFVNAEMPDEKVVQPVSQAQTPLYVERQVYLQDAPLGVNVNAVKGIPGADGEGITVFDIEQGFNFLHEDLVQHNGRVVVGRAVESSRHHGAAVCGVVSGYNNSFGITGIVPKSKIFGCSFHDSGSNHPRVGITISKCATHAKKGDILLLEMHAIGPNRKFIAMNWWPDNFAAIKHATENGLIVVAAGGNGAENLDAPIYNRALPGFPGDWRNPFNRSLADDHSIIVGAGAPPPGTHGRNWGADRSRLDFSNYGSVVDCQGIGREVTTIGYGDLFNQGPNRLYTDTFSGTSSSSPIVVGPIASIQGILKKRGKPLLTSRQVRELLRRTGSPQQPEGSRPVAQKIGNRPDLKQLLDEINN